MPNLSRGNIRRRNQVRSQQLRHRRRINLVRLDPRRGNRFDFVRVRQSPLSRSPRRSLTIASFHPIRLANSITAEG